MTASINRLQVGGKHYTHEIMIIFDINIYQYGIDGYSKILQQFKKSLTKQDVWEEGSKFFDDYLIEALGKTFQQGTEINFTANVENHDAAEVLVGKWREIILTSDLDTNYQIVIAERSHDCKLFYCPSSTTQKRNKETTMAVKYLDSKKIPYTLTNGEKFIDVFLNGNSKAIKQLMEEKLEAWWCRKSSGHMTHEVKITNHKLVDSKQIQNEEKLLLIAGQPTRTKKIKI